MYRLDNALTKSNIIYMIIIDTHFYIGSTSRPLKERLREHKRLLSKDKHYNKKMQSWFNINKEFTVKVMEETSRFCLCEREQYWINLLHPDINIINKVAIY